MINGINIGSGGTKTYYKDNFIHRKNGPAVEGINGDKYWYVNDKLHRKDGPAIEYFNGYKEYYHNDEEIICYSNEEFIKLIRLKAFW